MVTGLGVFRRHFADFTDRYVLIGGVAATLAMQEAGPDFRATKDVDLVLIVEALDVRFAEQFWRFVEAGGYEVREKGGKQPQFYRFQKPADPSYPVMLELFTRAPDGLPLHEGAQLTPVPVDDAVSNLSAILLDEQYCRLIVPTLRVVTQPVTLRVTCPIGLPRSMSVTSGRFGGVSLSE